MRDLPDYSGPLVINAALTGMVPCRREHPAVPEQPDEIALDAAACIAAGCSHLHLHARDLAGEPAVARAIYADIIRRVRALSPDVVICVSTSGRLHRAFEERSDALGLDDDLRPDLASLTLGSLNFPKHASVNEPAMIRRLADAMNERGIVPELEVFDLGMLDYAHYLIGRGVLRPPFVFNLLLGETDAEARYALLNAVVNQLRFPNAHTLFYSTLLLRGVFLQCQPLPGALGGAHAPGPLPAATADVVREQLTRVLLERVIVHRPHPWGLLVTFIELIRNQGYAFWTHGFTRVSPEAEK